MASLKSVAQGQLNLGIVVIGRNEATNLQACLESSLKICTNIVYVDSGSTDESIHLAAKMRVPYVELDDSKPFSAARARNEGALYLDENHQELDFIHFIDGDCVFEESWAVRALELMRNSELTVLCGVLSEVEPSRTIYTRLCNIEWKREIGETDSCGGIFLIRKLAFIEIGGFNETLIAGEEPELCRRLRNNGGKIFRDAHQMASHDSGNMGFSQWWKRTTRNGVAVAQSVALQKGFSGGYGLKDLFSIGLWASIFPISVILTLLMTPYLLVINFLYPIKVIQIYLRGDENIQNNDDLMLHSFFCIAGKFPELYGLLTYLGRELFSRQHTIIEHKITKK